jgi:phenylalanyl-tRNA synthetase beta chain
MPVQAMRVVEKNAHPKTDQLFVYTFESPALGQRIIVANLENTYQVGDMAAVALEGTWLPGLRIKPRKVFGLASEGMALGVVDAAVDADLTEAFEADRAPRTFRVTIEVEVEARYPEDAKKAGLKAARGNGQAVSVLAL